MRAMLVRRYGEPDVVELGELVMPRPDVGEVLVPDHRTVVMFVSTSGQILDGLATMIEKGQVRPIVERTFAWDELAEAHRRVETGRVTGKVAIVPHREEGANP